MWFCLVDLGPGQMMVDVVKLLRCPGHFALSGANPRPADTRDPTSRLISRDCPHKKASWPPCLWAASPSPSLWE